MSSMIKPLRDLESRGPLLPLAVAATLAGFWFGPSWLLYGLALVAGIAFLVWVQSSDRIVSPNFVLVLVYSLAVFVPSAGQDPMNLTIRLAGIPLVLVFAVAVARPSVVVFRFWVLVLALSCSVVSCAMYFQTAPGVFDVSVDHLLSRGREDYLLALQPLRVGPTTIAALIGTALLSSLYCAYVMRSKWLRLVGWTLVLGAFVLLVLTASRTAVVGTLVAAIFMFAAVSPHRSMWNRLLRVAGVVGVGGAILYVGHEVTGFGEAVLERYDLLVSGAGDKSLEGRIFLWNQAIDLVDESVSGYGFRYFYGQYYATTHNEVLGQLVGAGVVAVVLFLVIFGRSVYEIVKAIKSEDRDYRYAGVFCGAFLILAATISTTENFSVSSTNLFYFAFWFVIAFALTGLPRRDVEVPAARTLAKPAGEESKC